ncbi:MULTISPECIES: helix-turn-helix domain-containing protein [Alicyclobacillus]|uniref:Helix-turn-helix domain-containing protein n=1 Tax=Alicyclobacillus acidoterrestris (strain ATCC 49025 / DSM 3922 / CIP 106132 / NCIMB 13137 / GD3B) TaxID=1356854 RepID=T0BNQ3_ALIAG|nr:MULTISPECIES: helix-turn-helix domain-containing protein [Alicyclobacillus]EPZ42384.1 hypothetical protein N007_15200 [Alicyclobacillus acidoterrestris ATCC 49025]UNO50510.1 helix-turn-helix domain-containing protein [Alicyclobacillus acidoterrestris]
MYTNMLSVHEVAKILRLPVVTVYELVRKNCLPANRLDQRILISKYDLSVWLQGQNNGQYTGVLPQAPRRFAK